MPTLNGWGKKAGNITAILLLAGTVGAYINSLMPSYALASDLKAHIQQSDNRYLLTVKKELKKQIKGIENEIALYDLDKATRALTPRENLHQTQLINMKAEYLRDLQDIKVNPLRD